MVGAGAGQGFCLDQTRDLCRRDWTKKDLPRGSQVPMEGAEGEVVQEEVGWGGVKLQRVTNETKATNSRKYRKIKACAFE